jgi:hypothetical protein
MTADGELIGHVMTALTEFDAYAAEGRADFSMPEYRTEKAR